MATLAGGGNPAGTITFTLYEPFDPTTEPGTCTNCIDDGRATVIGSGLEPRSAVSVSQAGRYRWIASYSGDPNNNAVSTSCGDAGETRSEERRVGKESRSRWSPYH